MRFFREWPLNHRPIVLVNRLSTFLLVSFQYPLLFTPIAHINHGTILNDYISDIIREKKTKINVENPIGRNVPQKPIHMTEHPMGNNRSRKSPSPMHSHTL